MKNGNYTFNWMRNEAKMKKILRTDVFLSLNVWPNRFNMSENLMYIGEPKKLCPINSTKKEHKELDQQILKYIVKQIILNVSTALPSEESLDEAVDIIETINDYLCRKINKTTTSPAPYHRSYKFQDLQHEIDLYMQKEINKTEPLLLQTYIGYIFDGIKDVNIDFQHDLLFIWRSTNKSYILDNLTFVYKTPEAHIEFYMWCIVVIRMVKYTHLSGIIKRMQNPHQRTNSVSERTLELICARSVSWYMNFAVAYGIVDKNFQTTTGRKVRFMIEQLRDELRENIRKADWLDEETRASNLEKLEYMSSFIGVPDWFFEKSGLEKHYRNFFHWGSSYFQCMISD
ncbi:endothelin-converting enzyme-like 1 [Harmonia axyridis]|uniref:endothelin-converting enzyme-like 1 n=1 Tax=Harmonia axyridis TaxID=115357 RepID=UPI001E278C4A|nr:endothelin-converting enzyme-like 1 [Harmonia axyridis]